jgi:electron transfer flavoprotein alpha subunit
MAGTVLVVLPASGAELAPTALEAVAAARRVADELGGATVAVLLAGKNVADAAPALGAQGADRVLLTEDTGPTLDSASPEWLVDAATQAARRVQPDVILLPHAGPAREIGPRLAARLGTGIVTDSTAIRVQDGRLLFTKPVFGGSAVAEMAVTTSPQVATLRPRAFETDQAPSAREARVETLPLAAASDRVEVLEEVQGEVSTGPRLKDAKIIVSGGRGLGGPENWRYIEELAQVLGAAVGATRAVTDAGWVPPALQVGLTGVSVAPDLYITVGISGAVQHIAGISGARNVVAINRDADANIFKYARYGVVGDWKQIVPAFTDRLKQLRG